MRWQGDLPAQPGAALTLGLRPDRIMMVSPEQAQATGEVVSLEHLGDVTILGVRIDAATNLTLKFAGDTPARIGDRVHIGFELTGTSLFDGSDTAIS